MNKIEEMHLDDIDTNMWVEGRTEYEHACKAAKKSAEITEQISIEFAEWLGNAGFQILKSGNWTKNWGLSEYSLKTLFQEFLKTKE